MIEVKITEPPPNLKLISLRRGAVLQRDGELFETQSGRYCLPLGIKRVSAFKAARQELRARATSISDIDNDRSARLSTVIKLVSQEIFK